MISPLMNLRIGLGRDLHRLAPDRRFLLAGVEIPADKGLAGHSDGDVLAHAVIDALLGASGLGDIGEFFPPSDDRWKDADSMRLLDTVWAMVNREWKLINLDCVVNAKSPKILPHREEIRRNLAKALDTETDAVFVKGKTGEGVGPIGEGAAVEAMAVCLLERKCPR